MPQSKPLNTNSFQGAAQAGTEHTSAGEQHETQQQAPAESFEHQQEQQQEDEQTQQGEQQAPEYAQNQTDNTQQEQSSQEDVNSKEYNFKAVREAKEKAEKERDELVKYFMELQKQQQGTQNTQSNKKEEQKEPEDDEFQIDEEALLDGRYGKKFYSEIKNLKKQLNDYKQQYQQQTTETKLKQQYPDFDKVVNGDNIAQLKKQFPEIAQTLHETKDLYSKAVSAYGIIKRFGIYNEPQQQQKQQVQNNHQKPKPMASLNPQEGETPMQKANIFAQGLTPQLKEQLRKEMYESRKKI